MQKWTNPVASVSSTQSPSQPNMLSGCTRSRKSSSLTGISITEMVFNTYFTMIPMSSTYHCIDLIMESIFRDSGKPTSIMLDQTQVSLFFRRFADAMKKKDTLFYLNSGAVPITMCILHKPYLFYHLGNWGKLLEIFFAKYKA